MAISFLRKVHAAAAKGTAAEVRGELPLEVAYYLLNRKKRELAQIENDYDIEVTIKGKPSFLMNQLELLVIKREKPTVQEPQQQPQIQAVVETPVVAVVAPVAKVLEPEQPVDDGKPKKKRGSRKKIDLVPFEEPLVAVSDIEDIAEPEIVAAVEGETVEATSDEPKKKRRRKRRKKTKSGTAEQQEISEAAEVGEVQEKVTHPVDAVELPASDEAVVELQKKKRRNRRKRGGARISDAATEVQAEVTVDIPSVELSVPVEPPVEAPPKKPRVRAPGKKKVAGDLPLAEVVEIAPVPTASPEPEVVKPKRIRAKKVAINDAETIVAPAEAEPGATDKPKPKRLPRKKKADLVGEQE
jgi:ribonuclease E